MSRFFPSAKRSLDSLLNLITDLVADGLLFFRLLLRSKRPKLTLVDRLLWVWLSRTWSGWRPALAIVRPETVVAWHRKGFRLFWTWKVRHGQLGRPVISREVRDLIRKMCRENPSSGAPPIHGELLAIC